MKEVLFRIFLKSLNLPILLICLFSTVFMVAAFFTKLILVGVILWTVYLAFYLRRKLDDTQNDLADFKEDYQKRGLVLWDSLRYSVLLGVLFAVPLSALYAVVMYGSPSLERLISSYGYLDIIKHWDLVYLRPRFYTGYPDTETLRIYKLFANLILIGAVSFIILSVSICFKRWFSLLKIGDVPVQTGDGYASIRGLDLQLSGLFISMTLIPDYFYFLFLGTFSGELETFRIFIDIFVISFLSSLSIFAVTQALSKYLNF
ncbi:MAG: hypothetical protein H6868_02930 [Rhodospirillales bacterium]|nr:hypothetical protein [Rhodospirillales bacterium]